MTTATTGFDKEEVIKAMGFNKANTRILNVVVENERDLGMLMGFYKEARIDQEFTATSMLKEYKIDNCKLSFEDFMNMYMQDVALQSLKRLFWDDVIQEDIDIYLNGQYLKKHSLMDLYTNYMKKPHTPFLKFVKNN